MQVRRRYKAFASLTALAGFLVLTSVATPVFAWSVSYLSTCVGGSWSSTCTTNPGYAIGTKITDTAKVTLSNNGGTGSITFKVYKAAAGATCASSGSALYTSGPTSIPGSTTTTITSGAWDSTGQTAGNYVWIVSATYAESSKSGCEPFNLFVGPPLGAPQFPLGSLLAIALALPALLLVRARFAKGKIN